MKTNLWSFWRVAVLNRFYCIDIVSVTDISPCVKIDKSLVNYMVAYVMMAITILALHTHKIQQHHFKVEC